MKRVGGEGGGLIGRGDTLMNTPQICLRDFTWAKSGSVNLARAHTASNIVYGIPSDKLLTTTNLCASLRFFPHTINCVLRRVYVSLCVLLLLILKKAHSYLPVAAAARIFPVLFTRNVFIFFTPRTRKTYLTVVVFIAFFFFVNHTKKKKT